MRGDAGELLKIGKALKQRVNAIGHPEISVRDYKPVYS